MSSENAVLEKNGIPLVESVIVARSLPDRLKGLMGSPPLDPGQAMLIIPCSSVHTFFMRFNLDLVFLDREMKVVRIARNTGPFRIVPGGMSAHSVLEMTAGWLPADSLKMGDRLALRITGRP